MGFGVAAWPLSEEAHGVCIVIAGYCDSVCECDWASCVTAFWMGLSWAAS